MSALPREHPALRASERIGVGTFVRLPDGEQGTVVLLLGDGRADVLVGRRWLRARVADLVILHRHAQSLEPRSGNARPTARAAGLGCVHVWQLDDWSLGECCRCGQRRDFGAANRDSAHAAWSAWQRSPEYYDVVQRRDA